MKIHEFLDSPSKWTTRDYAKKANGDQAYPYSEAAVCWCALGLMRKFYDKPDGEIPFATAWCRLSAVVDGSVASWNDAPGRTFEEVREAFRRADL